MTRLAAQGAFINLLRESARWACALILGIAGVAKIWSPFQAGLMLERFAPELRELAPWLPNAVVCLLGSLEIAIGVQCARRHAAKYIGYLLVIVGLCVIALHVFVHGFMSECGCFGGLFDLSPTVGVTFGAVFILHGTLAAKAPSLGPSAPLPGQDAA